MNAWNDTFSCIAKSEFFKKIFLQAHEKWKIKINTRIELKHIIKQFEASENHLTYVYVSVYTVNLI